MPRKFKVGDEVLDTYGPSKVLGKVIIVETDDYFGDLVYLVEYPRKDYEFPHWRAEEDLQPVAPFQPGETYEDTLNGIYTTLSRYVFDLDLESVIDDGELRDKVADFIVNTVYQLQERQANAQPGA